MPNQTLPFRRRASRPDACSDQVVGAILSGWRYDISGISPDLRGDYEAHLEGCAHCRRRQRLHRSVDLLLLCATTLSFAAFLLMAVVMHRLEALTHIDMLRVHLHPALLSTHVPPVVTISLEAIAIAGVFVSMVLWVLVAIATPVPAIVTGYVREHISGRIRKQAA